MSLLKMLLSIRVFDSDTGFYSVRRVSMEDMQSVLKDGSVMAGIFAELMVAPACVIIKYFRFYNLGIIITIELMGFDESAGWDKLRIARW